MKEEPKTRLDTLISIHNRMYEQAISIELDILILSQDLEIHNATQEFIAATHDLTAKKVDNMNRFRDYTRLAAQLIKEEINKTAVSKNN